MGDIKSAFGGYIVCVPRRVFLPQIFDLASLSNRGCKVAFAFCALLAAGCSGAASTPPPPVVSPLPTAASPTMTTSASMNGAVNGAVLVTLASTTQGATIHYTKDGSPPTVASSIYTGPFLVASNLAVSAMVTAPATTSSSVTTQNFAVNIPAGTLVWSDEFSNSSGSNTQPNPQVWTYDAGPATVNNELEDYCAWNSSTVPCSTANPNSFIGTEGYLHIVARQPSPGVYTSARLKTQNLFSLQYGRLEFRAQVPEAQGFWPAAWLMGNNIATIGWPACGEQDVLERVNAASTPDWNTGSIHGVGFIGTKLGTRYNFPSGQTAASWHTYGMIWSPGSVAYYVDDPNHPYVTYTKASIATLSGSVWPFDAGDNFIILNLAVGGQWPGPPDATTPFPAEMLVDYVRVYTN